MTVEYARLATVDPAAKVIPRVRFRTPPFDYAEGALDQLKKELSNEAGEVELIHMQILCQAVERRMAECQDGGVLEVTEAILGGEKSLQRISSDFYRAVMHRLSWPVERTFARRLCEQGLLSPEGHRISIEEGQARRKHHVTEKSLAKLVDSRLVRRDTRPGLKGFYYELSHDSLARSVFRHRRSRFVQKTAFLFVLALILTGSLALRFYQEAEQSAQVAQAHTAGFRDTVPDGSLGLEMVVIPAGSFAMGCVSGKECNADELPVRTVVTFDRPFAIGKYEVTFAKYDHFAEATGREKPEDGGWGRGQRPVINVSSEDAQAYASWLSKQTSKRYRVPSEAEWEYAARAGTRTQFWWGDRIGSNRANCLDCGSQWDGMKTAPVGSFAPNPFGLHDTAGNVWEWTQDCWHWYYEGAPIDGTAWEEAGGGDCGRRVVRGGSWGDVPEFLRSAYRYRYFAGYRNINLGFRLAQDL
jgi:formylglycine-generating enzyme required for sulfatase activity